MFWFFFFILMHFLFFGLSVFFTNFYKEHVIFTKQRAEPTELFCKVRRQGGVPLKCFLAAGWEGGSQPEGTLGRF